MIVHNDYLLIRILYPLLAAIALEFIYRIFYDLGDNNADSAADIDVANSDRKRTRLTISQPPVHCGRVQRDQQVEDFLAGSRHIPQHSRRPKQDLITSQKAEGTRMIPAIHGSSPIAVVSVEEKRLALLRKLPNCEPDGQIAQQMRKLFPDESIVDVIRFLVARKGNLEQATTMMRSAVDWHSSHFPSKRHEIIPALQTGCFFAHGKALDGTPILFMRGAFYSSKVATPLQYVLAAAYVIDTVLAESDQICVTVLVHACGVKGAPNESADINFIKLFVQILSDNYPERLKRLVIYPFPWFSRALWGIIKMFMDKRTQEKVVLIPGKTTVIDSFYQVIWPSFCQNIYKSSILMIFNLIMLMAGQATGYPAELAKHVNPNEIPVCCGGSSTAPIFDMIKTILN